MLLIFTILLGSFIYLQVEKFEKPYQSVRELIAHAKADGDMEILLFSNQAQHEWNDFKRMMNKGEFNYVSYTFKEDFPLYYKMVNANRNKAGVDLYFYDEQGAEVGRIRILLEKVDGSWQVAGFVRSG